MASYQIYQFDGVALPLYNPESDVGTGATPSTLERSIGGTYDYYGTRQRLPDLQTFGVRGTYAASNDNVLLVDHAGNYLIDHNNNHILVATPTRWLRAQVDALRGKHGVSGIIRRRRWDDPTVTQWKTARLLSIKEKGNTKLRTALAEFELQFETPHPAWRSAALTIDNATLLSGGQVGLICSHDGNAPVADSVITVIASGGTITSFQLSCSAIGVDLRWAGTLTTGQALVIDCGAQTVTDAGANAYSGFTLGSGHTAVGWLPLAYGINVLLAASNGPGTISVSHYDKFI